MNKFDDQDAVNLMQKYEDKMTEDERTLCSLVSIAFVSSARMNRKDVESWRLLQSKLNRWEMRVS